MEKTKEITSILDEMICPISNEPMLDPHLILQTGMIYDKKSIDNWFKVKLTCPMTNAKLSNKTLIPLPILKNIIRKFLDNLPEFEKANLFNKNKLESRIEELKSET